MHFFFIVSTLRFYQQIFPFYSIEHFLYETNMLGFLFIGFIVGAVIVMTLIFSDNVP